jgi:hypothetical protein
MAEERQIIENKHQNQIEEFKQRANADAQKSKVKFIIWFRYC